MAWQGRRQAVGTAGGSLQTLTCSVSQRVGGAVAGGQRAAWRLLPRGDEPCRRPRSAGPGGGEQHLGFCRLHHSIARGLHRVGRRGRSTRESVQQTRGTSLSGGDVFQRAQTQAQQLCRAGERMARPSREQQREGKGLLRLPVVACARPSVVPEWA